jgi:hypothetical protein
MGFKTGIVSNGYWATSLEDARAAMEPFAGCLHALSVSTDFFHYDEFISDQSRFTEEIAKILDISSSTISIASPTVNGESCVEETRGTLPPGESDVMYRGRAAVNLIDKAGRKPWDTFVECPYEDLVEPGRVHLDALGNLHICQGISIGNIREKPLKEICAEYDPYSHPIVNVLLEGGPAALVQQFDLPHDEGYADACHLCYNSRLLLRERFPHWLAPDQIYGVGL